MPHHPNNPDSAIALHKSDGNPEGKGLNGLLLDLHRSEPRGVVAKPHRQVLAELFTSMLVLSASFKYRPATGVENFLYWRDDEWSLSLDEALLMGEPLWVDGRTGALYAQAHYPGAVHLEYDNWDAGLGDLLAQRRHLVLAVRCRPRAPAA